MAVVAMGRAVEMALSTCLSVAFNELTALFLHFCSNVAPPAVTVFDGWRAGATSTASQLLGTTYASHGETGEVPTWLSVVFNKLTALFLHFCSPRHGPAMELPLPTCLSAAFNELTVLFLHFLHSAPRPS
jgi:hypothetical protein